MEENRVAAPMEVQSQPVRELPEQEYVDFVREYPNVHSLPEPVIQAMKQGQTMSHAYGRHEVRQLRAANQQLQAQLNRMQAERQERGIGSLRSTGGDRMTDSFLMGFNEE